MNFETLIEPYKENGRTPQGQIKWLISKGIERDKIDQAMLIVYDEIERGKALQNGHELDRYLLDIAQKLVKEDIDESVKRLETFFNTFKDKWQEELKNQQKPKLLNRIKAVFKP